MSKTVFFFIFLLCVSCYVLMGQSDAGILLRQKNNVHAGHIVLKLKSQTTSSGRIQFTHEEQLEKLRDLVNYEDHVQVFAQKTYSNARVSASNLQNIFKIKLKSGSNVWRVLAKINALDFIEYAEPFFQNELLFVPNDPQADPSGGQQTYLSVIKAYDGWQIDRADSSIVVGIVDTGVNMNHEDLGNIAFNYNDPINGVDDDGDGYIDNFQGWDISNDDNDPTADTHPHGTNVAGLSSATANNGIGMAGVGFNSKYLPVKIAETTTQKLLNEYEGIIYAADHGCDVVNLSWGGAGTYSKYGQDIINYAVLERDVVVVAAAGNTPEELNFYPASFENVLSVGATDINDNKATWATYSHFIDVMAPGHNVYTTKNNGGYEMITGSSFAAPIVAGAAALVRAHFPDFTALQVMEQLRVTSDNIYNVGSNMDYFGQLGRGRLNVRNALIDILTPAIRISEMKYSGNHDELIFPGDTVNVALTFTNYLRNAENVTVTITNPSANVSWEVDKIYIEQLGEFESFTNIEDPLCFVVNPEVSPGDRLLFRIDFIGNNYTDFQYVEIYTTPGYFDISDGNLTTTISSDGDIGFDNSYFINGNGISLGEDLIASNAGLIASLDSVHVMDNVINNFIKYTKDQDFTEENIVRLYDNSIADYDARSVFTPNDTIVSALDIKVEQKILTWENQGNDRHIIFEYRIINTGDSALNELNVGLFADWDLGDYQSNAADWDDVDHIGYVFDKSAQDLYSGIAILTDQIPGYYAIDLASLHGNQADLDSLFQDKTKHDFLSTDNPKATAGTLGEGNDVAHIVGGKGIALQPNQTVKIAFAMLASTSLDGLKAALDQARTNYGNYLDDPPLAETFYACTGDCALVDPAGEIYEFFSDVELTQRIDSGNSYTTAPVFNDQVYYAVNLDSGYLSDIMKILVTSATPKADFDFSSDTLLIENGQSVILNIDNKSVLSDQYQWDFGNGFWSTVEAPKTVYNTAGPYSVELIASNVYGCSDTATRELLVAIRLDRPVIQNQEICKGNTTEILASNTNRITVYKEKELHQVLFTGDKFNTGIISSDTVFYVINSDGDFESLATETSIVVKHPVMGFDYHMDTLNLDDKYVLQVFNSHGGSSNMTWLVDGHYKSNAPSFHYVYPKDPFTVAQVKVDEEGCTDTLSINISPQYSNIPVLNDVQICENSGITIHPQNGKLFYFYEDIELTTLIHKGSGLHIPNISQDLEVYITGIDGMLESASESIKIKVDPVQAIIETTADTLDLASENQVQLQNQSIHAEQSFWLWETGTMDTTTLITDSFTQIGEYKYMLVAEGNTGCYDTAFQTIYVMNITGIQEGTNAKLKIYPNPVRDHLIIAFDKNQESDIEFELMDISGKIWKTFTLKFHGADYSLNVSSLPHGIYFLRSKNPVYPITTKILKQ